MATRIVVNGREYSGVEEMPPDVRANYERALAHLPDADRNGVPDILEGKGRGGIPPGVDVTEIHHHSITVNGKTYDSIDDLPPDVRRVYESALAEMGIDPPDTPSKTTTGRLLPPRDTAGASFAMSFGGGRGGARRPQLSMAGLLLILLLLAAVLVLILLWRR